MSSESTQATMQNAAADESLPTPQRQAQQGACSLLRWHSAYSSGTISEKLIAVFAIEHRLFKGCLTNISGT